MKTLAAQRSLPVHQPAALPDSTSAQILRDWSAELCVVVAYGHLIPRDMLAIPTRGFVNLHASLLPKYRGAAPVPHAIRNGEEVTGVTVFKLNEQFDAGAVLGMREVRIQPEDTTGTLLDRLGPVGAALVVEVVDQIRAGTAVPVPQTQEAATRAPKLTKESGHIDWTLPRAAIGRLVRAMQPWPLAHAFVPLKKGCMRMVVLGVEDVGLGNQDLAPGTILQADAREGLWVQCGDGALRLSRIKPEGKREMAGEEYLRGAQLSQGLVLR